MGVRWSAILFFKILAILVRGRDCRNIYICVVCVICVMLKCRKL